MTDISKYKSLAVDHACYDKIDKMTKVLAPGITLSRAQVIRMLVDEKAKKLNGKIKKARLKIHVCSTCKGNGYVKVASLEKDESTVHQCWDCDSEGEFYEIDDMGWIDDGASDSLH